MFSELSATQFWSILTWTMIHTLWLGGIVAIAYALARIILRRAPPSVRYVAALSTVAAFAAIPIAVAAIITSQTTTTAESTQLVRQESDQSPANVPNDQEDLEVGASDTGVEESKNDAPHLAISSQLAASSSPPGQQPIANGQQPPHDPYHLQSTINHLPWLWLIGTPLLLVLFALGVIGSERLRRQSRLLASGPVIDALARLRNQLGSRLTRKLAVAVCDRVAAPVLIGIVRPLVLLPPAALTGWSPQQIEMVLLHELAHVRRWDNLINLLLRLFEAALFFHPATWWLTRCVRQEQEHCSDAFVLVHLGKTATPDVAHSYARFLLDIASASRPQPQPAAGSALAAANLRTRIRYILNTEQPDMRISFKTLLGLAAIAALAVAIVTFATRDPASADEPNEENTPTEVKSTDGVEKVNVENNNKQPTRPDPNLTYDGKSFDWWRTTWRTELKTEKRTEAIRALAAFGAHGYGRQAAKTIIDVVKHYDTKKYNAKKPEGQLVIAAREAFTGGGVRIPAEIGMQVIVEELESGDERIQHFARGVVNLLSSETTVVADHLLSLSEHSSPRLAAAAVSKLSTMYPRLDEATQTKARRIFQQSLASDDEKSTAIALQALYGDIASTGSPYVFVGPQSPKRPSRVGYLPQLVDLLDHPSEALRTKAIDILRELGANAQPALPELIQRLNSEDQQKVFWTLEAIQALGAAATGAAGKVEELAQNQQTPHRVRESAVDALYAMKAAPEVVFHRYVQNQRELPEKEPRRRGYGFVEPVRFTQLGQIAEHYGKNGEPALKLILLLLIDDSAGAQEAALSAVRQITGSYDAAEKYLKEFVVSNPDSTEKIQQAAQVLNQIREYRKAGASGDGR